MLKETNEKQITDNEQIRQENMTDTNVDSKETKKEAWEYFQEADKQTMPKKKNKVPGFICLILGFALLVAGVFTVLIGNNTSALESMEPMDIYYATETDQYVYTEIQYMTEAVAYYEAMETMQFYIVCDKDWATSVICIHNDDLDVYQPYIDWLYSDSYENEPEAILAVGYAQPYDEELKQLVMEGFIAAFGEGIIDESNFTEYFGEYYLQIGQASGAYGISNTGIYLLLVAIILIVIGGSIIYEKPQTVQEEGPVIQNSKKMQGIVGALLGALLGGLAWSVIGALGFVSGWIGILIIFFAFKGYSILSRKEDKFGMVLSVIFGLVIIPPATYLSYGWSYYSAVNQNLTGYTTLTRALAELPDYMSSYNLWGTLVKDILMGYFFMLLAGFYMNLSKFSTRNKQGLNNKNKTIKK